MRTAPRNLDEEATYIAADDAVAARLVVARVLESWRLWGSSPISLVLAARAARQARVSSWF